VTASKAPAVKEAAAKVPLLSAVLRSLATKVHPDLLTNYPEQKETNEASLSMLQGFLSALKDSTSASFPTIQNEKLRFYLRTATPGHFRLVQLHLHVPGGKCKDLVAGQLKTFFADVGLATDFVWDKEFFPLKDAPLRESREAERRASEEGEAEAEAAKAENIPEDETYEQFQERIKRQVCVYANDCSIYRVFIVILSYFYLPMTPLRRM